MDVKHKQSTYDKQNTKLINLILLLCLSVLAVMIGKQAGDVWYRLDVNLVEKLDTENFKNTLNLSMPIIESVYNSGKYSVSFSGEIRDLVTKLFGFDLENPETILNVQSPIFMSYYNISSAEERNTADTSDSNSPEAGSNALPGDAGKTGTQGDTEASPGQGGSAASKDNTSGDGQNAGQNTGADPGNGAETGSGEKGAGGDKNNPGTGDGKTAGDNPAKETDGNNTGGQPAGSGQSGNAGPSSNTGKAGDNPGTPADLTPISSITYEDEDDEKAGNSDLVALDSIVLNNYTKYKIDIAKLLREPLNLNLSKTGPKVLVYHTHTSESYVLKASDLGKKDVPSFSSNPKNSVVRVGEELSRYLRKYGIDTLHDGTVHDKVRDAAYGVAINTLQSYKKSYPSVKVFIDVHRDAASNSKLRMVKNINGKNAAQIMFVVGTDGMLPHPDWQENLKFVLKLQQELNRKYPGLAKPVRIVGKRYNQQISNGAILIEVGGDGNLLSECLESTKYLAEALNKVMNE